jgi:hypothetical protein
MGAIRTDGTAESPDAVRRQAADLTDPAIGRIRVEAQQVDGCALPLSERQRLAVGHVAPNRLDEGLAFASLKQDRWDQLPTCQPERRQPMCAVDEGERRSVHQDRR